MGATSLHQWPTVVGPVNASCDRRVTGVAEVSRGDIYGGERGPAAEGSHRGRTKSAAPQWFELRTSDFRE